MRRGGGTGAVRARPLEQRALLAIVLLWVLALALGCAGSGGDEDGANGSSSDSTTRPADADAPPPADRIGAPAAGDCIEPLTSFMSSGPLMPAVVPCDASHGGEVITVHEAPPETEEYPARGRVLTGIDDAVSACDGGGDTQGAFAEFAGDNRLEISGSAEDEARDAWLVSSLEGAVFLPSPSAWEAGERWVVCAAIVRHSEEDLNRYTGSARGVLVPGELGAAFAWCKRQTDPSNHQDFVVVSCEQPHTHEQVASFSVGGQEDPYPGEEALSALVGSICPDLAGAATGGRFDDAPEGFSLSWTYPVESTWSNGDRTGRCYVVADSGSSTGTVGSGTATIIEQP